MLMVRVDEMEPPTGLLPTSFIYLRFNSYETVCSKVFVGDDDENLQGK